jgi:hypothetical protein
VSATSPGIPGLPRSRRPARLAIIAVPKITPAPEDLEIPPKILSKFPYFSQNFLPIFPYPFPFSFPFSLGFIFPFSFLLSFLLFFLSFLSSLSPSFGQRPTPRLASPTAPGPLSSSTRRPQPRDVTAP